MSYPLLYNVFFLNPDYVAARFATLAEGRKPMEDIADSSARIDVSRIAHMTSHTYGVHIGCAVATAFVHTRAIFQAIETGHQNISS